MRHCLLAATAIAGLLALGCEDKKPSSPATRSGAAAGQTGEEAAATYQAAWAKIPPGLADAAAALTLDDEKRPAMMYTATWQDLAGMLEKEHQVVADLIAATKSERCGFGVSHAIDSPGELDRAMKVGGEMRSSARILRADAVRLWLAGDGDGAVERLAAMYRLADHTGQQHVVLLSMVSSALIRLTNETVEAMVLSNRPLTAEQRERLLTALNTLDATDPSGMVEARTHEEAPDATVAQTLDQGLAKLTQSIAQTRKTLRGE